MPDRRSIESCDELLEVLELATINFTKYEARLTTPEERAKMEDVKDNAPEPEVLILPQLSDSGERYRIEVELSQLTYSAQASFGLRLGYVASEPIENPSDEVVAEFLGRSAMLTAIPHFREALLSASARLGVQLPFLALYRSSRAVPSDFEEIQAEDADND